MLGEACAAGGVSAALAERLRAAGALAGHGASNPIAQYSARSAAGYCGRLSHLPCLPHVSGNAVLHWLLLPNRGRSCTAGMHLEMYL